MRELKYECLPARKYYTHRHAVGRVILCNGAVDVHMGAWEAWRAYKRRIERPGAVGLTPLPIQMKRRT
jgi:hypothetical protein